MAGRKPKVPPSPFNGLTLDRWQESDPFVSWAKSDKMFGHVLAVIQNGMMAVKAQDFDGYRQAMANLLALRVAAVRPTQTPTPTYSEPLEEMNIEREQSGD